MSMFLRGLRANLYAGFGALLSLCSVSSLAAGPEIWLIRHAESEINVTKGPLPEPDHGVSYPLTALGVKQAAVLGASFVGVPVQHLYSSTRLRTLETAAAISRQTGVPITLAPGAVEIDFGSAPDLYADVPGIVQQWLQGEPDARLRGEGESLTDVRTRFLAFWDVLSRRHAGEEGVIVLVTHGGIIGFALPELCPELDGRFIMQHPIGNTQVVRTRLLREGLSCLEWNGIPLPAAAAGG